MNKLASQQCQPVARGSAPLDGEAVRQLLSELARPWELSADGKAISLAFDFGNFHETMAFVNAVAWIAHQQDHHPDMSVGYKQCTLTWSTHAAGGLTRNDFICAARVEALFE